MSVVNVLKTSLLLLTTTLVLAGCASPKQANIDYDRSVNFEQYQTFAFFKPTETVEATAETKTADTAETAATAPSYDPLQAQHFKAAIIREMTDLGYRYNEQSPQLLVNYQINTENREDVRSSPFSINAGYGFFGRNSALSFGFPIFGGVETHRYKVGSILIDVIDASENRLIWQGMTEGKLAADSKVHSQDSISAAVALIYQRYPTRLSADNK
ncbi:MULTISPECIES: DUF4136 domain-containing protein [unclassified Alishewanella]|uniref:DUF4136 domain-containing protein n=1 Tax=unclassified Alishewanella TaxID=2628974 RepID=UPI00404375A8